MFSELLRLLSLLFNVVLRIACLIIGLLVTLSSVHHVEQSTVRFVSILLFGIWFTFQSVTKNGPYKILFLMGNFFGWIFGSFKYSNIKNVKQKEI